MYIKNIFLRPQKLVHVAKHRSRPVAKHSIKPKQTAYLEIVSNKQKFTMYISLQGNLFHNEHIIIDIDIVYQEHNINRQLLYIKKISQVAN